MLMRIDVVISTSTHLNLLVFFFNDTATTEIYTLSLHDALPISCVEDDAAPGPPAPEPKRGGGPLGVPDLERHDRGRDALHVGRQPRDVRGVNAAVGRRGRGGRPRPGRERPHPRQQHTPPGPPPPA